MTILSFFGRRIPSFIAWSTLLVVLLGVSDPTLSLGAALLLALGLGLLVQAAGAVQTKWSWFLYAVNVVALAVLTAYAVGALFDHHVQASVAAAPFNLQSGWVDAGYNEFGCSAATPSSEGQDSVAKSRIVTLQRAIRALDSSSRTAASSKDVVQAKVKAYIAVGDAHMADCHFAAAQEAYQEAFNLGDEFGIAGWKLANLSVTFGLLNRANAQASREAFTTAAAYYQAAAQNLAGNERFLNDVVEAQVALARHLPLMESFDQWVDSAYRELAAARVASNQADVQLYWRWATALDKLGYGDVAEQIHREAVALYPNRGDGWFLLGQMLERGGELEGAVEAYQIAVTLAPDRRPPYSALERLYASRGWTKQIIDMYADAAAQWPNVAWLQLEYAKAILEEVEENTILEK